ncbi:MAG TPA: NBR1-Ig-like domain-containing protein [Longilinea sp.]|nr:NBR1-Ig-like domain-containing protein [Longilinea sp.]
MVLGFILFSGCSAFPLNEFLTSTVSPDTLSGTLTSSTTGGTVLMVSAEAPRTDQTPATMLNGEAGFSPTASATPSDCLIASAGVPLDVTIPDDTVMEPGSLFLKTWRLVNSGVCAWQPGTQVMWYGGDLLGAPLLQSLTTVVQPGGVVEISVQMQAPQQAGEYTGYWILTSPDGQPFGIGPSGTLPFWVQITVQEPFAVTLTSMPTSSAVMPFSNGVELIGVDVTLDLDTGMLNGPQSDITWRNTDGMNSLSPMGNTLIAYFGLVSPDASACQTLSLQNQTVVLTEAQAGSYYCYMTMEGRLGMFQIISFDPLSGSLILNYLTWVSP